MQREADVQRDSQADFEAAIAEPTKLIMIYVHEGPISDEVRGRFQEYAPKFAGKIESYKLDTKANPSEVWERIKLEKLPSMLIFKEGKEVARVEEPDQEKMEALAGKLFA